LLIFTLGFSGLCFGFRFSEVDAQVIVAPKTDEKVVYGDVPELEFCGPMVSQVNFLEIKEGVVCSKDNPPCLPKEAVRRIKVILTAYSSTVAQTDDTPFITANGTYVYDGIIANNGFPFGTKIRIPELFGDKVFSVEDRMHWRMGGNRFDIWFPTYEQAKNFGVKYAFVEVINK
jgi:3D (Asp-Asp-Asp) domain-containing protein